jgi:hypothetical protein
MHIHTCLIPLILSHTSFGASRGSRSSPPPNRITPSILFASRLKAMNPSETDKQWILNTQPADLINQYNQAVADMSHLIKSENAFRSTIFSIMCIADQWPNQSLECMQLDPLDISSSVLDELDSILKIVFPGKTSQIGKQ